MAVCALHLCSGYAGFELALRPFGVRTVGHVERDCHAAALIVARMAQKALDEAPVWDDLATFDGSPWRGRVDLITAGFPCQPFSSAGAKRGTDDEHWIWEDINRVIGEVGPRIVVLENVPQLVRHGLPEVLSDLARGGFDAQWSVYAASAAGAPHERRRLWILAYTDGEGLRGLRELLGYEDLQAVQGHVDGHRETDLGGFHWRGFPPKPGDTDAWREWISAGGPEPVVRRSVDGRTGGMVRPGDFSDRLFVLGNGISPPQATEAIRLLAERALTDG